MLIFSLQLGGWVSKDEVAGDDRRPVELAAVVLADAEGGAACAPAAPPRSVRLSDLSIEDQRTSGITKSHTSHYSLCESMRAKRGVVVYS